VNFASSKSDLPDASESFRAVGYGHSADLWKNVIAAYADVGYDGMLSIENEDRFFPEKSVLNELHMCSRMFALNYSRESSSYSR
jgi:sugar phosphate isomerase/epimerase